MNTQEGMAPVTGGKVWYKRVGQNTTKPPLIVIHGGPGSSHDYMLCLEALSDDYQVIFYDQLGCGRSDKPHDTSLWTLERYTHELHQLIQHLNLQHVSLLGYSWGSMIAIEYTLHYPQNIIKLILSSPVLSVPLWIKDTEINKQGLCLMTQAIIKKNETNNTTNSPEYQQAIQEYNKLFVCRRLDPLPASLKKVFANKNNDIYELMWGPSEFNPTGNLKDFDRINQLHKIKCPVLFNCGEFDSITENSLKLGLKQVENGSIHVFKGSSHLTPLESENEYIDITRNFLAAGEAAALLNK